MLAIEIILIVVGVACICASFFISKKKNTAASSDEEIVHGADLWTEKDEEVIIKHIDEILEKRGMELVETTEDQMNRICNEKIMAIDEFTKPLLEKIHVNHEEVVFMYNMLGEKQKEIRREIEEDTLRKAVPVITPPPAEPEPEPKPEPKPKPKPSVVNEEILSRLPLVESEDTQTVVPRTPVRQDTEGMTGLEKARLKMETIPDKPAPVSSGSKEYTPEISTGQPLHPVDKLGTSSGNQIGSARTVYAGHQYNPNVKDETSVPQMHVVPGQSQSMTESVPPMRNQSITPVAPQVHTVSGETPGVNPLPAPAATAESVPPKERMKRPSRESVMQRMEEPSGVSHHAEAIEDRVRALYKQGRSVVDISKELNMGQGEVKLMIAMYKKRR